jgi:cytochrome c553
MKIRLPDIRKLHWPTVGMTLAALAVVGLLAGVAIVVFGLYNVSARVGHFPGVSWMLHTTFRNSVDLRAGGEEPPEDLGADALVALGARHYDSACTPCHARPGQPRSATAMSMVPRPPHASDLAGRWSPEELHWIVYEGAKMTGMPYWPSPRKDDVWPVVAFVFAAEEMDGERYAGLTERPDGAYCAMCHGTDGVSGNPEIPRLDIQSEEYLARSLAAYRDGTRSSGIMQHAASVVAEDALPRLARMFAEASPRGEGQPMGDRAEEGRRLAYAEGASDKVPACRSCHGPWEERLNPLFPSLAGQYEPYLRQQLRLWREEQRGGTEAAELMHHAARDLSDADIEALAAYYAAMAPAELDATGRGRAEP